MMLYCKIRLCIKNFKIANVSFLFSLVIEPKWKMRLLWPTTKNLNYLSLVYNWFFVQKANECCSNYPFLPVIKYRLTRKRVRSCNHRSLANSWYFSNTWLTCPSTLTFLHIYFKVKFSSIKNVDLSAPMYFLPYIDFSFHALRLWISCVSGSDINENCKLSFFENDVWLAKESLDTPKILTPADSNSAYLSLNSLASLVHPEVLSLGYINRIVHCPSKSLSLHLFILVASKLKLGPYHSSLTLLPSLYILIF